MGIFGQLDSQFQDQITNNVKEKTTQIGEGLQSAVGALTDLDKAAFAMEVVNTDSVGNLITSVGERLKSWLDKINGLEGQNNTPQPNVAPTINTGTNTVAQIAQNTAEQVQGKVTFDTSDGEAKLDNLQAKAQETISIVEQGATFKVKVQSGGLSRVAKQANTINKASGNKNINVTATASGQEETENLTTAVKDFKALSDKNVKLSVTVSGLSSISSAISQVHSFYNLRDDTVTLTTKHENKATGGHNHGYAPAPPSLGSAARGSYGQIGPKGKGGLTLTGELGYEIAWLPDENRSMILGAEGPQMVNLPGNAVVWTHEQSKRMMKQKAIPAGSHADESANAATYIKKYANNTSTNSGSTILSIAKDTGTSLKDTVKDAAIKVGKVSVFWENLAHRIEGSQRIMDRNASNFENYLKDMRATLHKTGQPLSSGGGGGNDYIKSIQAYSYLNQLQYNKATKSLKKYTKKNKKNKVKIKWKEGKEDKSYRFNFNDFIKYDSGLDTFTINQKALNKVAKSKNKKKGGKNAAKAIKAEAEKRISDKMSKRNTAQDNILKAQQALEKMSEELYDTFFAWENELTKIWELTQKIEAANARIDRKQALLSMYEAQSKVGLSDDKYIKNYVDTFKSKITEQMNTLTLKASKESESIYRQKVLDAVNSTDLIAERNGIQTNYKNSTDLNDRLGYAKALDEINEKLNARELAYAKYLTTSMRADGTIDIVNFNQEQLMKDKEKGDISTDTAKEIISYVKNIEEANKGLEDYYKGITEDITKLYEDLNTLDDKMVDYAKELHTIAEESDKEMIEQAKLLSSAISDALKKLLDGIKQKLDERRKQEDNAKTEQDISKKQQRLTMLQADTAGGHQVEIAQLQQEIAEAQQNYQRDLEDQILEKLQQQGDLAAEQREKLIELTEATNDAINNAAQVDMWMADPEKFRGDIVERYKESKHYKDLTKEEQGKIVKEAEDFVNNLIATKQNRDWAYKYLGDSALAATAGQAQQNEQKGNTITSTHTANANVTPTPSNSTNNAKTETAEQINLNNYNKKISDLNSAGKVTNKDLKDLQALGNKLGYTAKDYLWDLVKTKNITWKKVIKAINSGGGWKFERIVATWPNDSKLREAMNEVLPPHREQVRKNGKVYTNSTLPFEYYKNKKGTPYTGKKYATGGLADYTGPAWLDGTPSKPELVLNAQDTKNFIALKDVLSKAIGSTSSVENTSNNATFEININVDHLNNDYDVDKVVERVKKKIVQDSSYRNVTQVRKFR